VLWFSDRRLVASETTTAYYRFENAFPLADGWWVLALVACAWALRARRPSALGWLLVAGGAGLYLFRMDVLYDAEHGIWTKGGGGAIEAVINVATLVINLSLLAWSWNHRVALLASDPAARPRRGARPKRG
jgi:hypothetical protein